MAEQLLGSGEAAFSRHQAVGAKVLTDEWKVAPEFSSGSLAAVAAEISQQAPSSMQGPTDGSLSQFSKAIDTSILEVRIHALQRRG